MFAAQRELYKQAKQELHDAEQEKQELKARWDSIGYAISSMLKVGCEPGSALP